MNKLNLYNDLVNKLTADVTSLNTIGLFRHQFLHGTTVTYPTCFIDYKEVVWTENELGVQTGNFTMTMHLGFDAVTMASSDTINEAVYQSLQMYEESYFTPLIRVAERNNSEHSGILVWEIDFETTIVDTEVNRTQNLVEATAELFTVKGIYGEPESFYSYAFSDSADSINIGNRFNGIVTGSAPNFTFSALVRRETDNTTDVVISQYSAGAGNGAFFLLFNSNDTLQFTSYFDGGAGYATIYPPTLFRSGAWFFVQVVYDSFQPALDKAKLFVNGIEYSSAAGNVNFLGDDFGAIRDSTDPLLLGASENSGWTLHGDLNHVALWDIPLSSGQIKAMYNLGEILSPQRIAMNHLVAYWQFDNDEWDGINYGVIDEQAPSSHSIEFDGTVKYLHFGVQPIERTDAFSFVFHFKRNAVTETTVRTLMSNMLTNKGIWFAIDQLDRINLFLYNSASNRILRVSLASVFNEANKWYHAVVTYDGSSTAAGLKFFIDGVEESLSLGGDNLTESIASTEILELGATWLANNRFNGHFNHVGWFDHALSQTEIDGLYHKGYTRKPSYLKGCISEWLAENAVYNGSEYEWPDSVGTNHGATNDFSGTEKQLISPFSGITSGIDQADKKLGSPTA